MPDIERRIEAWRRDAARALPGREDVLDELAEHLRQEVQQLLRAGRPEDEAWAAALARLGSPEALAAEFAKVPPAPAAWLPARVVTAAGLLLGACLVGALAARWQAGLTEALLAAHVGAVTLGYGATLLVGALAVCHVLRRPFGDLSAAQRRWLGHTAFRLSCAAATLTAVGVFLGAVWARDHLGRFWGWDLREIGGLVVLAWDVVLAVFFLRGWPRGGERLAGLLAVAGNVVVALAWFGPAVVAPPRSYGPSLLAFWLLLFTGSQVAVLAAGLAPAGWIRRRA
jgi:Cytochrome C assembly protein